MSTAARGARAGAAVLALGCVTVALGIGLKAPCVTGPWDGRQFTLLCYSDVQALYSARGLDHDAVPYSEVDYEYPVATGAFMYTVARLTHGINSYTVMSYLLLGVWGLVLVAAAWSWAGVGAWRAALAPSLVLTGFLNWDLLAVGLAAGGWWMASRRRWGAAGLAIGAGAAAKLYPAFLVPALAAALWAWRGDEGVSPPAGGRPMLRAAGTRARPLPGHSQVSRLPSWLRFLAGTAGGWAVVNVPVMVAAPRGWLHVWTFHADRPPDFDTPWYWWLRLFPGGPERTEAVRHAAGLALELAFPVLVVGLALVVVRSVREGLAPLRAAALGGLGAVVAFLLLTKVFSPQYTLWLLPLFVAARVPWPWWVAYELVDVGLVLSRFRWFLTAPDQSSNGWSAAFGSAVGIRWLLLGALLVWCVRSMTGGTPPPDRGEPLPDAVLHEAGPPALA